jgi:carbonic anhydrase
VEIVFDQGLGDLFVIRVAGNIVSSAQLGSIEFAAGSLGARLVVVLGHTDCGAVDATLKAVQRGGEPESENLRLIVERIRPSAERAITNASGSSHAELVDLVGRDNVHSAVDLIRNSPGIIRQLAEEQGLMVIGAEYSVATGAVEFF